MKAGDFIYTLDGWPGPVQYFAVIRSTDGEKAVVWDEFLDKECEIDLAGWKKVEPGPLEPGPSTRARLERAAGQESAGD